MGRNVAINMTGDQHAFILGLLKKYLPDITAWAYGSRVKQTARPYSDLDMVVFATRKKKDRFQTCVKLMKKATYPFGWMYSFGTKCQSRSKKISKQRMWC